MEQSVFNETGVEADGRDDGGGEGVEKPHTLWRLCVYPSPRLRLNRPFQSFGKVLIKCGGCAALPRGAAGLNISDVFLKKPSSTSTPPRFSAPRKLSRNRGRRGMFAHLHGERREMRSRKRINY